MWTSVGRASAGRHSRLQQGQEHAWPIVGSKAANVVGVQGRRLSVRKQVTRRVGAIRTSYFSLRMWGWQG